jgi:hypothetical protein
VAGEHQEAEVVQQGGQEHHVRIDGRGRRRHVRQDHLGAHRGGQAVGPERGRHPARGHRVEEPHQEGQAPAPLDAQAQEGVPDRAGRAVTGEGGGVGGLDHPRRDHGIADDQGLDLP